MGRIYMDHQGGTGVLPEVVAAMTPFWTEFPSGPGALHREGLKARQALENARKQAAVFVGARREREIIFTSGGTEAANLAILGYARANRMKGNHLVASNVEHPAVLESLRRLEAEGFAVTLVPVDAQGRIDPLAVSKAFKAETILVATHLVNHELGTIQRITGMAELAKARGVAVFCDATAAAGWLPLNVEALQVDLLSVTSRRLHGPRGAGFLYCREGVHLEPLIVGGMQEEGGRAGAENIPALVGMGVASEVAGRECAARVQVAQVLQGRLVEGLMAVIPDITLLGPPPGPERVANHVHFVFRKIEGEALALLCDLKGIAATTGPACVNRDLRISPVLEAIQVDPAYARGNLLLTLGKDNTAEEVEKVIEILPGLVRKIREMNPLGAPL